MTIACKHMDPLVGIDTHITLIPSPAGPIPTPLPNPYVGIVFDPMDYVPFLGATVWINGMPRGCAGGSGQALPPHLPLAGPFAKPPSNESEIFMGSATVLSDGDPQSFLALPVLSCQDIGMPAPPRPKKKKVPTSLMLPTTVVLCVPMGPPVLIGGPPTINMMAMAMKGVMAGLKKLGSLIKGTKAVAKLSEKIHAAANKLCDKLKIGDNLRAKIHKGICSVTGHPVDVATGRVFTDPVDFALPGPLPLVWERTWYSTSTYKGPLGHGWHHAYDVALHVTDEVLLLRTADGRHLPLPVVEEGKEHFDRTEKLTISRTATEHRVRGKDGLTHVFNGSDSLRRLARIEDGLGNRITMSYSGSGRLDHIVDSGGRTLNLQYGADGLLIQVDAPAPDHPDRRVVLVRYEYDPQGNLVYAHDALGYPARYEYSGRLLCREVNRNGLSFYFEYDGKDEKARCVRTWGEGGIYDHKLVYQSGVTVVENSLGNKTTYHHRGGLVWKTVDALGAVTVTERNEWNEVVRKTDALGLITEMSRDERGNLINIKSPDGGIIALSYDTGDRPISFRSPAGGEWKWAYDQNGRMRERIDALGQKTEFRWSGPRVLGVIDPQGGETLLEYDGAGNLSTLHLPNGAETRWSYDRLGRCLSVQAPGGSIEARQFDLLGRVLRVQDPDGDLREISYDGEGNVVRVKDRQRDIQLKYGGLNRIVERAQAGATVRFAYDTEERLVTLYNQAGAIYRFIRGPSGEVDEEHGFDGLQRKYERDKAARVKRVVRPGGLLTECGYDPAGRLVRLAHKDSQDQLLSEENFSYSKDGHLTRAANATCSVTLQRDPLGRVIKETTGQDTVSTEYGPLGLRTRMYTSRGHLLEIERDAVGEVLRLRANGAPVVGPSRDVEKDAVTTWEARFSRNALGLEIERHLPGGVRSRWERDSLGRPLNHEIWSGDKQVSAKSYAWEPNDRLTMIVDALRGPVRLSHDGLGNLTAAAYPDGNVDLRMPDAIGNLFKSDGARDRKYGAAGQLLESWSKRGITRYAYDPEGNLTLKVLPDGSRWKYEWNPEGRLVRVTRPDGRDVTFAYDALGRRLWKKYQGKITRWIWDGNVPVHEWVELDASGAGEVAPPSAIDAQDAGLRQRAVDLAMRASQGPPVPPLEQGTASTPVTWVFDPETFAPAARLAGGQQCAIIADHVGTPTAMLDGAGQTVWAADIGICGELRNVVGDKQACPFRWPGQYEDDETGLYYNRFRYYDPDAAAYLSQDPAGLAGANPTAYAYVGSPDISSDPLGLAGDYSEMPGIPGHQKHHAIPQSMDHPVLRDTGFDVNNSRNIVYLPKESSVDPSRTVHRGMHNADYDNMVRARLDEIHNLDASPEIKRMHVENLSDELGEKLRSKQIQLNSCT